MAYVSRRRRMVIGHDLLQENWYKIDVLFTYLVGLFL